MTEPAQPPSAFGTFSPPSLPSSFGTTFPPPRGPDLARLSPRLAPSLLPLPTSRLRVCVQAWEGGEPEGGGDQRMAESSLSPFPEPAHGVEQDSMRILHTTQNDTRSKTEVVYSCNFPLNMFGP
ncbi:hypothetical protein HJG60_009721 [Phyllostomus discolor]|uniref:Uncharacterized protein n=1 Tax=Phyllostomus discolor TaxID=89673 RepID=A0A834EQB7_9CHIR|nr:hypothetical protein HJG60_009721 [Phyllostomus discolor]